LDFNVKSITIIATLCLSGCVTVPKIEDPKLSLSPLQEKFDNIKSLDGPEITIAVYEFTDKTGQRKPSDKFSQLSSAVTQGAEVWVIDALQKIGNGTWFQVVERIGLDNLIKERQLIRSTREQYEEEKSKN
jgi:curli production assembly/transport component CsgG